MIDTPSASHLVDLGSNGVLPKLYSLKLASQLIHDATNAFADDMDTCYVACDRWRGRLAQIACFCFFVP